MKKLLMIAAVAGVMIGLAGCDDTKATGGGTGGAPTKLEQPPAPPPPPPPPPM